jgi:hypothetical protein
MANSAGFALTTDPNLSLSINPTNPDPGVMVSATVSANEFSVDLSTITWSVDGKKVNEGKGLKLFSFQAPANGKSMTVTAKVVTPARLTLEKSITISPAGMDILWEVVDGYAPPFYKGKVLPIKQSGVRVVAMPNVKLANGKSAQAGDFVYMWKQDGENMVSQSGYGKNSFFFSNQILNADNQINVSATNGSKQLSGFITLVPFTPEILFYENNPDLGVQYQKALVTNTGLQTARLAVVAEPYNLLRDFKTNANAKIDWMVNNQKFTAQSKNEVILSTANISKLSLSASYNETDKLFRNFNSSVDLNIRK